MDSRSAFPSASPSASRSASLLVHLSAWLERSCQQQERVLVFHSAHLSALRLSETQTDFL